jgi:uncharacterized protein YkwD
MRISLHYIVITILMLLSANPAFAKSNTQDTTPTSVLADINADRQQHGLPQLQLNAAISQAATQHSQDMATHKLAFGHGGFSSRSSNLYATFRGAQGMAENVAYSDIDNAKTLVQFWFNSSGHRKNILGNYNLTGIGIAHDANGRVYATQIFLRSRA